jgi:hypothetical protein
LRCQTFSASSNFHPATTTPAVPSSHPERRATTARRGRRQQLRHTTAVKLSLHRTRYIMSSRSRRGVKFPHNRHSGSNGHSAADGRRSSFSDVSEDGSPANMRGSTTLENIVEVGRHVRCQTATGIKMLTPYVLTRTEASDSRRATKRRI